MFDRNASAPDIDEGEQEQPDDVNEVPIPGSRFKAEMVCRREVPEIRAHKADTKEDRADDDMRAVKAGTP